MTTYKEFLEGQGEEKWQKYWEENETFKTTESSDKEKFYVLDMFPYPSGAGLHVGHPKGYIATDVIARMKMMQGYNVLHPMGWDAFGLPAENYAIKNKVHPAEGTAKNVEVFKKQLELLGFTYDWNREVNTTDPNYYKWTQWAFIQMFKKGLAYESNEPINWCPSCKTGLANEDVEDGKCERCGTVVEQKPLRQWVLKITEYADRLLEGLDRLPEWETSIKEMQRNWIGKSEGAQVKFQIKCDEEKNNIRTTKEYENTNYEIEIFTTRPDTLFGATYMVLAPEHPLISECRMQITNFAEVEKYIEDTKKKTNLERGELNKEKTGVKLEGLQAVNPVNNEEIPVFIADYVMMGYGTGAIMAVPAHDERDWEFAKKFNLPIIQVLEGGNIEEKAHTEDGKHINSQFLDGLNKQEAFDKMIAWLEENNLGKKTVNYKLRDWVFSRQRYWGEPIPLVKCEACANRKYNYVIIHGYSGDSHYGFKPWLKEELEKQGNVVYSPDLPNTDEPNIEEQVEYILKNAPFGIDKNTVLLGHSLGAVVIYKLLEKINEKIGKAIFVDPVFKPEFNHGKLPAVEKSNDWKFNWDKIKSNCQEFIILGDKNHPIIKKEHLLELSDLLNVNPILVEPQKPHFSNRKEKFITKEPEVLEVCKNTGWIPLPEDQLPLELPDVENYEPSGTGESPLANITEWVNTTCPKCGGPAKRETNTMPQWAGSCWYYLRYEDPKNNNALVNKEIEKYWSPVDLYVGGAEHATRHLIYARFWHKFLYDIGAVHNDEPFTKLQHVGLILAEDGRKMSKRWNNVVNPDDIVAKYGADAMRVYEMFMGPFDQPCAWSTKGVVGARRFLDKVWNYVQYWNRLYKILQKESKEDSLEKDEVTPIVKKLHKTIKKVTEDIFSLNFNTAVSSMMEFINIARVEVTEVGGDFDQQHLLSKKYLGNFLKVLSPFAPHMAEELWHSLGHEESISAVEWPKYDPALCVDDVITVVAQVNGKVRDEFEVAADISEEEIKKLVLSSEKVQKWLEGKEPKKVIYVKGKLVSVVV